MHRHGSLRIQTIFLCSLMTVGCAHLQQEMVIAPSITLPETEKQSKGSLYLLVADNRESGLVGYRGDLFGRRAKIVSNENLAPIIFRELNDALVAQGFQVLTSKPDDACEMNVELRHLGYHSRSTLSGFVIETSASLRGAAYKGGDRYEEIHAAAEEQPHIIVPDAAENNMMVNAVLGRALTELVTDEALQSFLATRCH